MPLKWINTRAFIHAPADEVVNHALDYVFSKDRDFQDYLKSAEAHCRRSQSADSQGTAACRAAEEADAGEES